jgi:beta-1,4-mannooligosaccharide/beta-1,4-mannosyl-N-acetylglucosamine phosphorylase
MADHLFMRHPRNPLITVVDMPTKAAAVFNPGVAAVDDEVVLLLRIEDQRGMSHLRVARSKDGEGGWRIASQPLLEGGLPEWPYEEWGCEDPRITQIGPSEWVICYTAYSGYGAAVALAKTNDFEAVTRLGIIMPPNNKDATVLPQQIDNEWFLLHRPITGSQEHIWYASSNDLLHWAKPGCIMMERGGPWWDGVRIGVGAVPVCTEKGWLLIYHGVKQVLASDLYRLGLVLLDEANPRKVVARTAEYVFEPLESYERHGQAPNVVYTCGALVRGDEVWMYYGGADTCVCLARARLRDLVEAAEALSDDRYLATGA